MKLEAFPEHTAVFEPPMYKFHLSGGLGVLVGSNRLSMIIAPGKRDLVFFSVREISSMLSILDKQNELRVLGRNHFDQAEDMRDFVTTNFVVAAWDEKRRCLAEAQARHWGGVARTLHEGGKSSESLLAQRLSLQIRTSLKRFERLSIAYRTTLSDVVWDETSVDFNALTSDKYAHHIGLEYRSCLNELYSLRDAILVVMFRLKLGRTDSFSIRKLRNALKEEIEGAGHLIYTSMFSETGDKLIDQMSLYRSIALHCIGSTNPVFGDSYQICLSQSLSDKFIC